MLSDVLKDRFEDLGLDGGEAIRFQYYIDDNEQNVVEEIELLEE